MSKIKVRELIILFMIRKVTMRLENLNFGGLCFRLLLLLLLLIFEFFCL